MKADTTQYQFSHGKEPKGSGLWAFEVTGTDGDGAYTTETYFISGKYGDAKKEAVKRFKQECSAVKEITEVVVLP